jgi:hypothetical protein
MDIKMGKKGPAFVVHTTAPKQPEEIPGLLDGMWACLLNDYLDNLNETDEEKSVSSSSDANSISTAALRAERRRLRKLKKRELRRLQLESTSVEKLRESALALVEQRSRVSDSDPQLFQNLKSSSNVKEAFVDPTSKKIDAHKKKSKSRDKYEPVNLSMSQDKHQMSKKKEEMRKPILSRPALEPEAALPPLGVHSWSGIKDRASLISATKSQASSIDADGLVARSEWMQIQDAGSNVKSTVDPTGKISLSLKSRAKTRMDANGVIHIEESSTKKTDQLEESQTWHSRRDLFSDTQKARKSYHQKRSLNVEMIENNRQHHVHQKIESMAAGPETIHGRKELMISRSDTLVPSSMPKRYPNEASLPAANGFPRDISIPKDAAPSHDETITKTDTRDTEENIWSLEEEKRSELDEIRRKKLDREEALMRIRAIKARIAKLET